MYGLQMMDSWLYDDEKPFIHIEALDTFEFLKKQIGTGYYEELISSLFNTGIFSRFSSLSGSDW